MGFLDRFLRQPSPDKLAQVVMDRIRQSGDTRPLAYDREQFTVTTRDEPGMLMNLGNAYQQFTKIPKAEQEEFLRRWVARPSELGEDSLHALTLSLEVAPSCLQAGAISNARTGVLRCKSSGLRTGVSGIHGFDPCHSAAHL